MTRLASGHSTEVLAVVMEPPKHQLKPIGQWTIEYLKELPSVELDWIEYKASRWLTIDEKNLQDISKYLSAFANFDGGYLIIGATNPSSGNPPQLDEGVDFTLKNDLQGWLEDKLPHLTDRKLPKLQIQPIPLSSGAKRGPIIIYVPPSDEAPHQGHDHKFYTRIGTKLHALGTRAVFDIAGRQKHPDVSVNVRLNICEFDDREDPKSNLLWEVTNYSDVLCLHYALRIRVPLKCVGMPVLFGGSSHHEVVDGFEFSILSANNNAHPLFPRATAYSKIKIIGVGGELQNRDGSPKNVLVSDNIEVRVWADGAPHKDFSFPVKDVIKKFSRF